MGPVSIKGIPAGGVQCGGHLRNLPATHRKSLEVSEQGGDVIRCTVSKDPLGIRRVSGGWARAASVKDDARGDSGGGQGEAKRESRGALPTGRR